MRKVVVRLFLDRRLLPCLGPERSGNVLGPGPLDFSRNQARARSQWRTDPGLHVLDGHRFGSGLDLRRERRLVQGLDQQSFDGLLCARDILRAGGLIIGLRDQLGTDRFGIHRLAVDRLGVDGLGHIGIGIDPLGPRRRLGWRRRRHVHRGQTRGTTACRLEVQQHRLAEFGDTRGNRAAPGTADGHDTTRDRHRLVASPDPGHVIDALVREVDRLIGDECDLLAVERDGEGARNEARGTHIEKRPTAERFSFEKYFGLALFDHDRCWDSRMVDFRNPHLTGEFHPDTVTSASLPAL